LLLNCLPPPRVLTPPGGGGILDKTGKEGLLRGRMEKGEREEEGGKGRGGRE
jgi:hypothetical protein